MNHRIVENAKFLIVDDLSHDLDLLHKIFKRAGYQHIVTTVDPKKFVPLYEQVMPDIILLDLRMPEISGCDLLHMLKAMLSEDEYVPVLILSADITTESRHLALTAGATDFINKPFNSTEVLLKVHIFLEARFLHLKIVEQNQLLEKKVLERTEKLESAQMEILECLAKAAEFRDDDTGQHTQRVGKMSEKLARELGYGHSESETLRLAAPLHDVGKISISDLVLLKQGRLDPLEFNLIKTHTIIGREILSKSHYPVFQLAEKIAISHHECWGGSGYPYNLKGKQIPLEGQIVSIVDVFDSLIHHRPYKAAWTVEEAFLEIANARGQKFRPDIVDAFFNIKRELYSII